MVSGEFDIRTGRGRVEAGHLVDLAQWHRQHGLVVGFSMSPGAAVTLDGFATNLISELLVLAMIGLRARTVADDEPWSRSEVDPGGVCNKLCDEARFDFERIFR